MGWFDEQIEYRKKRENDLLSDSFQNIAWSVTGRKIGEGWIDEDADIKDAVSQLLKYFHITEKEVPPKIKELEDRLDYLLSTSGILYREVQLKKGWHGDSIGPMITTLAEDGAVITVLPGHNGGYYYKDPYSGRKVTVTGSEEKKIGTGAWTFYRPFPMRKLSLRDLWKYMSECLTRGDIISYGIAAAVVTLVGLIMPKLNQILMGDVAEKYRSTQLLLAVMTFMLCASLGNLLFTAIRELLLARIQTKLSVNFSAASMMRILSLPAGFFKDYSAGELNQYLSYMSSLCDTMVTSLLSVGITGLFSLVYMFQIFSFARSLVLPALVVTIATLILSIMTTSLQMSIGKEKMQLAAKEKGLVFSLISGIQKLRLSGAENRAFVRWSRIYAQEAALTYNPPSLIKLSSVFTTMISMIGTIAMYYIAVVNNVSRADYIAFNSAYGYVNAALQSLARIALSVATIRPILELIRPLLDAEPEEAEGLEIVTSLSGNVELSHVSFRYGEDSPLVLDDISINIPARQYVAIVGKTGCGKSTIMRLLLGFEQPTKGSIFYDKKDSKRLNMRSVRKQIGAVMQDNGVFTGSVFEYITISAPSLTLKDAWEAAEIAGLAEEIQNMPMGMSTMIQEGSGGISGGQRQRLMIARAIAPKPKLLLLDEATSALDNITQKQVSDALEEMRCTRIVIAHRLSTIRHCDRILVLDGGKIIEDGTYDELIALDGSFAELVARQRLDED